MGKKCYKRPTIVSMKRLIFIVEGETEEMFVNSMLKPYFLKSGFNNTLQCFKIKRSNGGMQKYSYVKQDILRVIYEQEAIVTTMFDFYALPSTFPGQTDIKDINNHLEKVLYLEKKMKEDLEVSQRTSFGNYVPYIQLHDFEALVFTSEKGFEQLFEHSEMNYKGISELIKQYPNPEEINDSPQTAPSKRIKKLIPGYQKVLFGNLLVAYNGMSILLSKCPHFRSWIETLKAQLIEQNKTTEHE